MEALSWFIHKYLFHGPLWFIHKTHHNHSRNSILEWNDVFSLGFALISIYLIFEDHLVQGISFWVGIGISIYGIIYFILHDWFTHARVRKYRPKSKYIKAIIRAHKTHHKSIDKYPSQEFGLLVFSKKFLRNSQ